MVTEREGGAPDAVTRHPPGQLGAVQDRPASARPPRIAGLRGRPVAHRAGGRGRVLRRPSGIDERRDRRGLRPRRWHVRRGRAAQDAATGFEILGQPEGIERLGGIDFDAAVFNHVAAALGGKLSGLDADDPHDDRAVGRLRQECVEAKEALSADTDASIPVLLPNAAHRGAADPRRVRGMVRPALHASIEALRRALRSAGVTPDQLRTVLLVGGSSRMPIVAQLVCAELGRPVAVDAHPKHAIALGAAAMSGRGFVNDRGQFTGPPSGAAPVTTAMAQGGPRTGANPRAPRTGGFPTGQHGAVPPADRAPLHRPDRRGPPHGSADAPGRAGRRDARAGPARRRVEAEGKGDRRRRRR